MRNREDCFSRFHSSQSQHFVNISELRRTLGFSAKGEDAHTSPMYNSDSQAHKSATTDVSIEAAHSSNFVQASAIAQELDFDRVREIARSIREILKNFYPSKNGIKTYEEALANSDYGYIQNFLDANSLSSTKDIELLIEKWKQFPDLEHQTMALKFVLQIEQNIAKIESMKL